MFGNKEKNLRERLIAEMLFILQISGIDIKGALREDEDDKFSNSLIKYLKDEAIGGVKEKLDEKIDTCRCEGVPFFEWIVYSEKENKIYGIEHFFEKLVSMVKENGALGELIEKFENIEKFEEKYKKILVNPYSLIINLLRKEEGSELENIVSEFAKELEGQGFGIYLLEKSEIKKGKGKREERLIVSFEKVNWESVVDMLLKFYFVYKTFKIRKRMYSRYLIRYESKPHTLFPAEEKILKTVILFSAFSKVVSAFSEIENILIGKYNENTENVLNQEEMIEESITENINVMWVENKAYQKDNKLFIEYVHVSPESKEKVKEEIIKNITPYIRK